MIVALCFWGGSIAFSIGVSLWLCSRIEASGVRRWGATGSLLRYDGADK
ncbi:hypothetical protein ACFSDD_23195 [Salipiger marinus]|jgi:hypothetical protein|nr:hypothetical protein [Salipiger manganoxidans]MEB3419241.1 hypothetical protein [Salipiger manganoxidans]